MMKSRRWHRAALVCICVVSIGGPALAHKSLGNSDPLIANPAMCETGDAPNGPTRATAPVLRPPTSCTGELLASDPADWFGLDVRYGQRLRIQIQPSPGSLATEFKLLDPSDVVRTGDCGSEAPIPTDNQTLADNCSLRADKTGIWLLGIIKEEGVGPYDISFEAPPAQNDCASGADAPETDFLAKPPPATFPSVPLSRGDLNDEGARVTTCNGDLVEDGDKQDIFSFTAFRGQELTARVTVRPTDSGAVAPSIMLRSPLGLGTEDAGGPIDTDDTNAVRVTATQTGTWFVDVVKRSSPVQYTIIITARQGDCGSGADAPDAAPGLPAGNECAGVIDAAPRTASDPTIVEVEDWYTFTPSEVKPDVLVSLRGPKQSTLSLQAGPQGTAPTERGRSVDGAATTFSTGPSSVAWDVRILIVSGLGGGYELSLDSVYPPGDDCTTPGLNTGDAAGSPGQARAMPALAGGPLFSSACAGQIRTLGDVDYFSLTLPPMVILSARFDPPIGGIKDPSLQLCLFAPGATTATSCGSVDDPQERKVKHSEGGTWLIQITSTKTTFPPPVDYAFTVEALVGDDCGSRSDAADTRETASPLPSTTSCSSIVSSESVPTTTVGQGSLNRLYDTDDWYTVVLPVDASTLAVTLVPVQIGTTLGLCVEGPAGPPQCSEHNNSGLETLVVHACKLDAIDPVRPCVGRDGGGIWYIQITHVAGSPLLQYFNYYLNVTARA